MRIANMFSMSNKSPNQTNAIANDNAVLAFVPGGIVYAMTGYNCTYAVWARVVKVTAKSIVLQPLHANNFCDLHIVDGEDRADSTREWSQPGDVDTAEKTRRAAIRESAERGALAQTGSKSDALYWQPWNGIAVSICTYD